MRNYKNIIMYIDKRMKESIGEVQLRNLLLCVFVGSLIPLFWITKYNFPSVDDFYTVEFTKYSWEQSHNVFLLIKEAVRYAYQGYLASDGRFVACFLFPALEEKKFIHMLQ